jgi:hypothetical protein
MTMIRPFDPIDLRSLSRFLASTILVGLLAATAAAAEETLFANAFAGVVDQDLFIGALVADDPDVPERRAVIVYLCDGADVSTWFFGEAIGGSTVLEADGARVELLLGYDSVVGVVEQAGEAPRSFAAELAAGDAGLFRAVETIDGRDHVGGWIVLNDARQRGAITVDGVVVENPTLDPSTGEAQTSLGTFGSNCFINPHTGERICRYMN